MSARDDVALICPLVDIRLILHVHAKYAGKYVNNAVGVAVACLRIPVVKKKVVYIKAFSIASPSVH